MWSVVASVYSLFRYNNTHAPVSPYMPFNGPMEPYDGVNMDHIRLITQQTAQSLPPKEPKEQQTACLEYMGFNGPEASELIDVVAAIQKDDPTLSKHPELHSIVTELFSRLDVLREAADYDGIHHHVDGSSDWMLNLNETTLNSIRETYLQDNRPQQKAQTSTVETVHYPFNGTLEGYSELYPVLGPAPAELQGPTVLGPNFVSFKAESHI